jgi:hypothetical protein
MGDSGEEGGCGVGKANNRGALEGADSVFALSQPPLFRNTVFSEK